MNEVKSETMNKEWIAVRISKELHEELVLRGKKNETFDKEIKRLINEVSNGRI
jgi:hypothetical protein